MIRKIIGTAGTRMLIAVINLMIMFLIAKKLGADGVGAVGLIVLGITIILLVNNFFGGTALVYLASREDNFKLLVTAYGWALITCFIFGIIMKWVQLVPREYAAHTLMLSFIYSISSAHLNLLLGHERIRDYNIITTIQSLAQFAGILILFVVLKRLSVYSFIYSLYMGYLFMLIASAWAVSAHAKRKDLKGISALIKRIFRYGGYVQVAYIAQMLNYRLGYYIIKFYTGLTGLGMFHFANQLAEGTWLIGRSIATVQYARVSNTEDKAYAASLSLGLMKVTVVLSLLMISVFLVLPDFLFIYIGKDFVHTRFIILFLLIGILANAASMMLSHYFAGLGKPKHNTASSSVGLIFTLLLGFWLIPSLGIYGAAITASVSYLSSLIYQMVVFIKMSGCQYREFMIKKEDFKLVLSHFIN